MPLKSKVKAYKPEQEDEEVLTTGMEMILFGGELRERAAGLCAKLNVGLQEVLMMSVKALEEKLDKE